MLVSLVNFGHILAMSVVLFVMLAIIVGLTILIGLMIRMFVKNMIKETKENMTELKQAKRDFKQKWNI